jgi:DnaJ-domain-containing protein 1
VITSPEQNSERERQVLEAELAAEQERLFEEAKARMEARGRSGSVGSDAPSSPRTPPPGHVVDWRSSDPYARLGVETGAPAEEVKRAFRRLVLLYHPDR